MSSPNVEALRQLIAEASRNPQDPGPREVIADWCEEHGLGDAATLLRSKDNRTNLHALSGLRMLLGASIESESGGYAGRYDALCGFPSTIIPASRVAVSVFTQPQIDMRLQKIAIPSYLPQDLLVLDVRVGKNSLFANTQPVPAEIFSDYGPDLFDIDVQISQFITILISNAGDRDITFNGCALGRTKEVFWQQDSLSQNFERLLADFNSLQGRVHDLERALVKKAGS
jgi:hypothetical protein